MFQIFVALALVVAAAATDYLYYRIPNGLVVLGLVTLGWTALADIWQGELQLVVRMGKGIGISLLLLAPVYLLGGIGAGDVKLLCVIGGFFGASGAVFVIVAAFCIGAGYGMGTIARSIKGRLQRHRKNDAAGWQLHRIHFAYAVFAATLIYGAIQLYGFQRC